MHSLDLGKGDVGFIDDGQKVTLGLKEVQEGEWGSARFPEIVVSRIAG